MKKRIVAIVCLLAMILSMSTMSMLSASASAVGRVEFVDIEPIENIDYSFAILGDVQTITERQAKNTNTYKMLTKTIDWILDNKEERKIEYVIGLGDTVDTLVTYPESYQPILYNRMEWTQARTQFKRLQGVLPYMVIRGNHDDEEGYHKYICTTEYQAQMDGFGYDASKNATLGNSMSNCYRKIEIGNHKYLMLGLDYNATTEVLEWANGVIAANPDYKVIISIHAYMASNGAIFQGYIGSSNFERTETEEIPFYGQKIWQQLVKKHANIFMVLSGHVSTDDPIIRTTRVGDNGNQIIDILVDPQSTTEFDPEDPEGQRQIPIYAILMLNFVNGGSEIKIDYIMPDRDKQLKAKNRFTIELPEGTLPEYIANEEPAQTEATTTAPETTATEAPATTATEAPATTAPATTEEAGDKGCGGSIASTVAVCCSMGTALAAFAMRKRKED